MGKCKKMIKCVEYIRKAPTQNGSYAYTSISLVFDEYTADGRIKMHYPKNSFEAKRLRTKFLLLSSEYDDQNWIPADSIYSGVKTALNMYKGKRIKTYIKYFKCKDGTELFNRTFYDVAYTLVVATKYHVVLKNDKNQYFIMDCRYADPELWYLA